MAIMNALLKFCFIFWMIYESEGQIADCYYRDKNYLSIGYKTRNYSYYTCALSTQNAKYNEKLITIDGQHETGHSDVDVKYLFNYDFNKLKTFSSIFCQKFPNLEVIHIDNAELESIDEDSLFNCNNLEQLVLYGKKLRELPEYLLLRNSKLSLFWIQNNQLTTLPENFFLNQKNLEVLFMSNNQINFLPSSIFRSLVKLELLYLNNNELESINPEWFVNLQNLKWLSLKGNQISEIPSNCFASLRKLEKLWLYKNKIKALNSDSFDGLQSLQTLTFHQNEISDLPVGVFAQLKNLQRLDLNDNKLTTIHSDSFGVHNKLTEVWLEDNRISSIDPKFIDKTAVLSFKMTNNICSQSVSQTRAETKNDLRNCFVNYHPRSVHVPSSCGRSLVPHGNIIGGAKIKPNAYPWIAALLSPDGQFFCGGTLVSSRKVLTAAHCIQNKRQSQPLLPRSVIVLLGFHDMSNSMEIGRALHAVQSIKMHSHWNPYTTSYDADIAVLLLDQEVVFNKYIQPICLTSADPRISALTEAAVVGNGKGGHENEYEKIPKILKMPIQTARTCTEKDSIFRDLLTGRTFCAGSGTGQGVCTGDSGSGLVVEIENVFYIRGIVSASLGNSILGCDVDSYSVFTDTLNDEYIKWINELSTAPVIEDRIIFV